MGGEIPFFKKKILKISVYLLSGVKFGVVLENECNEKLAILIVACVVAMATVEPSDVCFTLLVP